MLILCVEPYHNGSHKDFCKGLQEFSKHTVVVSGYEKLTWSMASLHSPFLNFTEPCEPISRIQLSKYQKHQISRHPETRLENENQTPEIILFSDYANIPGFFANNPHLRSVPSVLYMHENYLTYPEKSPTQKHLGFVWQLIMSCLWAETIWFNSQWHRKNFFEQLAKSQKMLGLTSDGIRSLRAKTEIVYPGIHPSPTDSHLVLDGVRRPPGSPCRILWNHRSDQDKGIDLCLEIVRQLTARGLSFEWIHLGEQNPRYQSTLDSLKQVLGNRLVHMGYLPSKLEYQKMLESADWVLSTSRHEFFGISVLEAILAGCQPLLPDSLSYPELIPPQLHSEYLYSSKEDLIRRLSSNLDQENRPRRFSANPISQSFACLHSHIENFAWNNQIKEFDARFESLILEAKQKTAP